MNPEPSSDSISDESFVVAPGGQGLIVDLILWLIGRWRNKNLVLSPEGIAWSSGFGRSELSWDKVTHVSVAPVFGPLPYSSFVTISGGSLSMYAHFNSEALATIVSSYKISNLMRRQASDAAILEAVTEFTSCINWHFLQASYHVWAILGSVGRYRPDLVSRCIHAQSVAPIQSLIKELGRPLAFETLEATQSETFWNSRLVEASLAWMGQHWREFESDLERGLRMFSAASYAERGDDGTEGKFMGSPRTSDRGPAEFNFLGQRFELATLLHSPTLKDALNILGLNVAECDVLYLPGTPTIAQGLIWHDSDGGSIWLWMEQRHLKTDPSRNWTVEDFSSCALAAVEYHTQEQHFTRWKEGARTYLDRLFPGFPPAATPLPLRPPFATVTCPTCNRSVTLTNDDRCPECGWTL